MRVRREQACKSRPGEFLVSSRAARPVSDLRVECKPKMKATEAGASGFPPVGLDGGRKTTLASGLTLVDLARAMPPCRPLYCSASADERREQFLGGYQKKRASGSKTLAN